MVRRYSQDCCVVSATGEDHCFQHDQEDELISVTCTFIRNVTRDAVCPVDRNRPLFDVYIKSTTKPISIVCYPEVSNTSELNMTGICTCVESHAGNSTCTLRLNTTQLYKSQVKWKFCSEQEIYLTVDNNSTSKHTPIGDQMPGKDVSINIAGAVVGLIAGVAIVTIFIVLLSKRRNLRTRDTISSTGEEGVALSPIRH